MLPAGGKTMPRHPCCPYCEYPITLEGASEQDRCPECGSVLRSAHRRKYSAHAGALFLCSCVAILLLVSLSASYHMWQVRSSNLHILVVIDASRLAFVCLAISIPMIGRTPLRSGFLAIGVGTVVTLLAYWPLLILTINVLLVPLIYLAWVGSVMLGFCVGFLCGSTTSVPVVRFKH